MRQRFPVLLVLAIAAISPAGCDDGSATSLPLSASPVVLPPSNPGRPDPNAIPIALGQTVTGVLRGDGPWCGVFDPQDSGAFPCQSYLVGVPGSGTLLVHVTWPEADRVVCAITSRGRPQGCKNTSPVDVRFTLSPGTSAVTFAVGFQGSGPTSALTPDLSVNYSVSVSFISAQTAGASR